MTIYHWCKQYIEDYLGNCDNELLRLRSNEAAESYTSKKRRVMVVVSTQYGREDIKIRPESVARSQGAKVLRSERSCRYNLSSAFFWCWWEWTRTAFRPETFSEQLKSSERFRLEVTMTE